VVAATLLCLLLCSVPILAAAASEARISGLSAKIEDKKILTSFRLEDGFGTAVLERVQSGLPTSFDYHIELQRKRRLWWDKDLAVSDLQVVAMYSAVTREYLINFKQDGKLVDSRVVHDAADLQRAMTLFENLTVAGIEALPEEGRVRLRIRAQLGSKTVMSFIPRDIHTDWAESSLLALPEAP
jgi:hypothetical protein